MYKLTRLLLRLAVLTLFYCAILSVIVGWPATGWLIVVLVVLCVMQKERRHFTTLGSARWASEAELDRAGMLDSKTGLMLGRRTQGTR